MTPRIFDRSLLRLRRQRAMQRPLAGSDFLLRHVAADISLRLQPVQREFGLALDALSPTSQIADALRQSGKVSEVVRMDMALAAFHADQRLAVIGDDETPPFAPLTFNLIVSALSLQAVNDVPGALAQFRRMLKADGLFIAVTLGAATLGELRHALAQAESEMLGGVSPRVAPFVDVRDMGSLLQRAGFALPVCDSDTLTVRYPHMLALMADLRAMAATNILEERRRTSPGRRFFLRVAEIYAARFADPDGRIRASFELVWALGWAPHDSQQKPLKPGSAQMRLAEALKHSR